MSQARASSRQGIGLVELVGAILAGYLSWSINHSIFWCAIHAMFSWLYVIYVMLGCAGPLPPHFW